MKSLLYLILLLPSMFLERDQGVYFQAGVGFDKAMARAKLEHKFLFVSCYAVQDERYTAMLKDVFAKENVGKYVNGKFISVNIQLDTLTAGNKTADVLRAAIFQTGFPAYLFFSPEGVLVHRGGGYKDADAFVKLAIEAQDPSRQYYVLKERFEKGERNHALVPYLLECAKELKDSGFAKRLKKEYLGNYLATLSRDRLYKKENITFLAENVSTDNKLFSIFLKDAGRIDSIMGWNGYSQSVVDRVISTDEIDSELWRDNSATDPLTNSPDWEDITRRIAGKFDRANADRIVINAKLKWYSSRQQWPDYCKAVVDKVEAYGPYGFEGAPEDVKWNELAWDMFIHCDDEVILKKALSWSDLSMKLSQLSIAGKYDTYANLLFKLGRRREAIAWEEKAVKLDPTSKDIRNTLEKMKKDLPTWRAQ